MSTSEIPDDHEIDLLVELGHWCAWCDKLIEPSDLAVDAGMGTAERMHLHCSNQEQDGVDLERSFEDW